VPKGVSELTLKLPAFAKINWSLRVIGKRPDGHHELVTIFQTISLHDAITLTVTNHPQIVLSSDDRSLACDEQNLVWRAAAALQARIGEKRGTRIRLEKRIPTQAGLGGGSADAAVTLMGLSHIWKIDLTAKEFLELAANLGADVPFFLCGGRARGSGIGTDVTPLEDAAERFLLVLKPNKGVSTVRAYAAFDASLTSSNAKTILSSSQRSEIAGSLDSEALYNDFEPAVFRLEPEIKTAKVALMKAGARVALLAGSGSAVFGIFDNKEAQERAIQAIELEAGWRVFPCTTVGRNHYRSAMGPVGEIFARFSGQNAGA